MECLSRAALEAVTAVFDALQMLPCQVTRHRTFCFSVHLTCTVHKIDTGMLDHAFFKLSGTVHRSYKQSTWPSFQAGMPLVTYIVAQLGANDYGLEAAACHSE